MHKNFFESFHKLNLSLNNTNSFLIDISLPIINYLCTNNANFEKQFRQACLDNIRFTSKTLEHDLLEKTDDFLITMYDSSEFIGCSCHNKTIAEFEEEIAEPLNQYCLFLINFVSTTDFDKQILTSDFGNDYLEIKKNLFEPKGDLLQAETSILYWQNAISDELVQQAILGLRYGYLKRLISEKLKSPQEKC